MPLDDPKETWPPRGLCSAILPAQSVCVSPSRVGHGLRLLRRAVTISNVLKVQAIEKARMTDALDALNLGVVLASEASLILHANRAAEDMMRDDGPLSEQGGVLRAKEAAAADEIWSAIKQAARNETEIGGTGLAVQLTPEGEAPVVAHVTGGEFRSQLDPAAVAAVFINPTVDDAVSAQTVASKFGLTRAETRLLTRVLSGKTVVEAAADLGVATTTARTHLDNIFGKTSVSRQSDLIRLAAQFSSAAASFTHEARLPPRRQPGQADHF